MMDFPLDPGAALQLSGSVVQLAYLLALLGGDADEGCTPQRGLRRTPCGVGTIPGDGAL